MVVDFYQAPPLEGIYQNKLLERVRGFRNNGSLFPEIPDYFNILKVKKVNNPHHYGMYLLHKEELKTNCHSVEEKLLYHVTSPEIASKCIAKYNIDWRKTKRSRFGIGACFAKCPIYAHEYANSSGAIVVCSVVMRNIEKVGVNYNMHIPKNVRNDTTLSNNHGGMVYVKYDDYSFYPKFIVYYEKLASASSKYKQSRYRSTYVDLDAELDDMMDMMDPFEVDYEDPSYCVYNPYDNDF